MGAKQSVQNLNDNPVESINQSSQTLKTGNSEEDFFNFAKTGYIKENAKQPVQNVEDNPVESINRSSETLKNGNSEEIPSDIKGNESDRSQKTNSSSVYHTLSTSSNRFESLSTTEVENAKQPVQNVEDNPVKSINQSSEILKNGNSEEIPSDIKENESDRSQKTNSSSVYHTLSTSSDRFESLSTTEVENAKQPVQNVEDNPVDSINRSSESLKNGSSEEILSEEDFLNFVKSGYIKENAKQPQNVEDNPVESINRSSETLKNGNAKEIPSDIKESESDRPQKTKSLSTILVENAEKNKSDNEVLTNKVIDNSTSNSNKNSNVVSLTDMEGWRSTEQYSYRCIVCSQRFDYFKHYKHHMFYHKPPNLKCSYCDKKFRYPCHLTRHMNSSHK